MSLVGKITTLGAALLFAGSAVAKESTCPDLSDIQAEGIQMAQQLEKNFYVGYSVSKYNTPTLWGFLIGPVKASSKEETLELTNELLSNLTAPGVPDTIEGHFVCIYDTGNPSLYAIAVKNSKISPIKFKQFIH